jgi:hypothetical protein
MVMDFINAETTDEACFTHFANIQDFLKFHPKFVEQAKGVFLPITPISSLTSSEKNSSA